MNRFEKGKVDVPSSVEGESTEKELAAVVERLRNKGIDPEGVMEKIDAFWIVQREMMNMENRYNTAATELAKAMGVRMEESQLVRWSQKNIRVEDPDLRAYHRLTRAMKRKSGESSEVEMPTELL